MNENHIHHLKIENFKSIKQASFDCKKVNIFIGKPNVGKSNILEALSLLSESKTLHDIVRFTKNYELFYDNDLTNTIKILTDKIGFIAEKNSISNNINCMISNDSKSLQNSFDANGFSEVYNLQKNVADLNLNIEDDENQTSLNIYTEKAQFISSFQNNKSDIISSNIRKYHFKYLPTYNNGFGSYLFPPFGDNIWNILSNNKKLREEVSELFLEYGLEFLMNLKEEKFELQKRVGNLVYQYDYSLTADTLQRIIFHYAAIESNTNSVLLFEEPESHSYPGYIRDLAFKIAYSETNQFFIATHSPYLLGTLMENLSYQDCAIFICSYKDYQTQIRELTQQEVEEAIDYGQDLFMNIDSFID